jgi:predicted ester cyclase
MNMRHMRFMLFSLLVVILSVVPVLAQDSTPEMTPEMTSEMMSESAAPITEEAANAFVERYDAMFDEPNFDIADEIFAPDFVSQLTLAPNLDREGLKQYIASFYEGAPDSIEEVEDIIIAEDHLILRVNYHGTHTGNLFGIPATGNPISMDGIGIFTFNEDGLAVKNWAEIDLAAVYAQIGAFPPLQEVATDSTAEAAMTPEMTMETMPEMTFEAAAPITEEAANTFVERFDMIFDSVDNLSIANEIFAPDFVGHLSLAPELDVEGWKGYVASFWAGVPDAVQEVNAVIVGEDRLVLRVNYHGTHTGTLFGIPATGNPISMNGIGIFTFNEDGLATENWAVLDLASVYAQIGAFPPMQ